MRIVKDPEERRAEILDTAEELFSSKGYAKTTIMDILNQIGIAKGTFYYYFKSKEEVLDAIIARIVAADALKTRAIVDDARLSPAEKLFRVLTAQKPADAGSKARMLHEAHRPENAEMHQKSLTAAINQMAPLLTEIVVQGVAEGLFNTAYPRESIELLLAAGQTIFDEGFFHWPAGERARWAAAFVQMAERTLGAAEGSLSPLGDII